MLQCNHYKSQKLKGIKTMKILKLLISLLCVSLFAIGCAKTTAQTTDSAMSQPILQTPPTLQSPQNPFQGIPKSVIIAKNGDTFDANNYANTLYHIIIFDNNVLWGGLFDEAQSVYKSPDREILYTLTGETLTIKDIAQNTQFTITHFS